MALADLPDRLHLADDALVRRLVAVAGGGVTPAVAGLVEAPVVLGPAPVARMPLAKGAPMHHRNVLLRAQRQLLVERILVHQAVGHRHQEEVDLETVEEPRDHARCG